MGGGQIPYCLERSQFSEVKPNIYRYMDNSETTEITVTDTDFFDIFIGRKRIDEIRMNDEGNCEIILREHGCDTKPEHNHEPRVISKIDIESVKGFFVGTFQSRPFARPLLLILWIREVMFLMGALKNEEVYDFIQRAVLELYGIEMDDETVDEEFLELLYDGYIRETNSGFLLESKGKLAAEIMFKTTNMLDDDLEHSRVASTSEKLMKSINELKELLMTVPTPTPKKLPDFERDGFWESQEKFAKRTEYKSETLTNHREIKKGMKWFDKKQSLGRTRASHYCRKKDPNNEFSPHEYFVYNDEEKNRCLMNPRPRCKKTS